MTNNKSYKFYVGDEVIGKNYYNLDGAKVVGRFTGLVTKLFDRNLFLNWGFGCIINYKGQEYTSRMSELSLVNISYINKLKCEEGEEFIFPRDLGKICDESHIKYDDGLMLVKEVYMRDNNHYYTLFQTTPTKDESLLIKKLKEEVENNIQEKLNSKFEFKKFEKIILDKESRGLYLKLKKMTMKDLFNIHLSKREKELIFELPDNKAKFVEFEKLRHFECIDRKFEKFY